MSTSYLYLKEKSLNLRIIEKKLKKAIILIKKIMEGNKNHEKKDGHECCHGHEGKKACGLSCKCNGVGFTIAKIVLAVIMVLALLSIGMALGIRRGERFSNYNRSDFKQFERGSRSGGQEFGCANRGDASNVGCAACANKQVNGAVEGCPLMRGNQNDASIQIPAAPLQ